MSQHQILSGLSAPCLHCGQQAHPVHLIGERDFYDAEHCPDCVPKPPLEPGEVRAMEAEAHQESLFKEQP